MLQPALPVPFTLLDRDACTARVATLAACSESAPPVLLWFNLDRFRQINESLGYAGGNQVMRQIVLRLYSACGDEADYGKVGADEFLCILRHMDVSTAIMLAEEILHAIEAPLDIDGITLYPTAAIGIAACITGDSAETTIQRADHAMRIAKQRGSMQWAVAGDEAESGKSSHIQLAREELDIESKLHLAIRIGGLRLHYQPILDQFGRVEAVEALMRCTVNGEDISPARFIPVAEKTGLIIRLGEWTLTQGAAFAHKLKDAGYPLKVAVNVSRAQLLAPHFARTLHSALIYAQVSSSQLELELTESLFMDMSDTVQENLCSARAAGVGLAIDDFGTGYSCLANLKDIHASKLKLDRSFTAVLPEDKRAFAIVKAMTSLGQELGMTVVAEGVETLEQNESLQQAGVNAIQGYLNAPAMPGEILISWLQQRQISPSVPPSTIPHHDPTQA